MEVFRVVLEKIYFILFFFYVYFCKYIVFELVKYGWRGMLWFMDFYVEKSYEDIN